LPASTVRIGVALKSGALSLIGARSLKEGEGKRADRGDMNIQKTAGGILLMREKPTDAR
jgi:hypothetical protein